MLYVVKWRCDGMLSPDPFIRNGRNYYYCGYFLFGFFSLSGAVSNNSCAKTAVTTLLVIPVNREFRCRWNNTLRVKLLTSKTLFPNVSIAKIWTTL
jgi:hypothetical protein